jgi:hypothetical protein
VLALLVIGNSSKVETAPRESFKQTQRVLVSSTIGNMQAELLERAAESTLQKGRGKASFGGPLSRGVRCLKLGV